MCLGTESLREVLPVHHPWPFASYNVNVGGSAVMLKLLKEVVQQNNYQGIIQVYCF